MLRATRLRQAFGRGRLPTSMVLITVLKALWRMLEPNRRVVLSVLVALQFVSGVFEMTGMLVILGFIRGLRVTADHHRAGGVGRAVTTMLGHNPTDWEFALYGGGLVVSVIL